MKDFKYKTSFSSIVRPLVSEEKDKYLAMASLIDIGEFIPDLGLSENVDLLPIAFNACVVNRANKNGDVIDTETAIKIYKNFINKPINVEHHRERVVGTILNAGFSEFGTDKPLAEEEVKDMNGPFNIILGGVIWKIVNDSLADLIEEAGDPTSQDYLKVSASWELGFADYNILITADNEKNIENAERIEDNETVEELKDLLKGFGGTGKLDDGRNVYRQVVGDVVPLGIGLTESPAADVKGVAVKKEERLEENTDKGKAREKGKQAEKDEFQNKNTSHLEEKNVIENKDSTIMKITNIKDITDESLDQLSASAVSDFISDEIKKVSDEFHAEKQAKEDLLKSSQEKHEALNSELDEIKSELEKMKQEKAEAEALETFSQRMSYFDEGYELNDEIREAIATDIKDMDEENFTNYKTKMALYLNKSKAGASEAEEKAIEKARESGKAEGLAEVVEKKFVEKTEEEVVEEAIENAEEVEEVVANTTDASEPSLYDKYKDAFSIDNFRIKL